MISLRAVLGGGGGRANGIGANERNLLIRKMLWGAEG